MAIRRRGGTAPCAGGVSLRQTSDDGSAVDALIINNSHDNVYCAVIMTKVIARVHPVHLMNVD